MGGPSQIVPILRYLDHCPPGQLTIAQIADALGVRRQVVSGALHLARRRRDPLLPDYMRLPSAPGSGVYFKPLGDAGPPTEEFAIPAWVSAQTALDLPSQLQAEELLGAREVDHPSIQVGRLIEWQAAIWITVVLCLLIGALVLLAVA